MSGSRLLGRRYDFAQGDQPPTSSALRLGHRHGGKAFTPTAGRLGQSHRDFQRIATLAAMGVADNLAAQRRAHGVVDLMVADLQRFQAVAIGNQAQAWAGVAVAVVDVDDVGHGMEDRLHSLGHAATGRCVRPVDLGQQGRHDRRTWWRFDDFDHRAGREGDLGQALAQVQGDGVAVAVAIILGRKRHRQVAHFGLVAQIIVTHEAIEIERRGGPGVGVDCGDFRQRPGDDGGVGQGALGGLQRGPLRHVQHHLELRFVVEWQQFHCHGLGGEHRAGHQGG